MIDGKHCRALPMICFFEKRNRDDNDISESRLEKCHYRELSVRLFWIKNIASN